MTIGELLAGVVVVIGVATATLRLPALRRAEAPVNVPPVCEAGSDTAAFVGDVEPSLAC